jgi:hypothetical protein
MMDGAIRTGERIFSLLSLDRSLAHSLIVYVFRFSLWQYHYFASTQNELGFRCGASLIHEDIMLSAAHCNNAFNAGVRFETLQVGKGGFVVSVDADRNVVHPSYNAATYAYDYRIFRLVDPVTTVTPVVMNGDTSIPVPDLDIVTAVGFGLERINGFTGSQYYTAKHLHEVDLPVRASTACSAAFPTFRDDLDQICYVSTS